MPRINITKPIRVDAKVIEIYLKIRDEFVCTIFDNAGQQLGEYEGYVPNDVVPGEFGDYLHLKIDLDTGQVLNWKVPSAKALERLINGSSD